MNRSYVLNLINEDDIEEAYEIIELFIDNIAPIDYENYMLPDATNEILNSLHSNLNVNQKFISFITNLYPLFYDNNINYSVVLISSAAILPFSCSFISYSTF